MKYKVQSNLDNATLELRDKVFQNVACAVNWLYKSVKERREREFLDEIRNLKIRYGWVVVKTPPRFIPLSPQISAMLRLAGIFTTSLNSFNQQ